MGPARRLIVRGALRTLSWKPGARLPSPGSGGAAAVHPRAGARVADDRRDVGGGARTDRRGEAAGGSVGRGPCAWDDWRGCLIDAQSVSEQTVRRPVRRRGVERLEPGRRQLALPAGRGRRVDPGPGPAPDVEVGVRIPGRGQSRRRFADGRGGKALRGIRHGLCLLPGCSDRLCLLVLRIAMGRPLLRHHWTRHGRGDGALRRVLRGRQGERVRRQCRNR